MTKRWSLALAGVWMIAVAPAAVAATISIAPSHPLMDARLAIAAEGLAPGARVEISSRTRARDGLWWTSRAIFVADRSGRVDLTAEAPVSGSYAGVDAMGLFWSQAPDADPASADHGFFDSDPATPLHSMIELREGGRVAASADIARIYAGPQVRATPAGGGVHGVLYAPNDGRPHPAVLVIGGSDGGPGAPATAMLLASHGYAALSLAYFGEPGLPATLETIPMETFARALDWLRRRPQVDRRFVAIYGESRGTEPALWTAAADGDVGAVIVRSPSFALWGGVTQDHLPGGAAWTDGGRPLAYIANRLSAGFVLGFLWDRIVGTPVRQTPLFLENLANSDSGAAATIPVEKIRAPVLLLAGTDDQIWPSEMMARRIAARRGGGHPFADALLAYDEVGHPIPYAYYPLGGDRRHLPFAVGGTARGTAKAQADAWPRLLAFLDGAVRRRLFGGP